MHLLILNGSQLHGSVSRCGLVGVNPPVKLKWHEAAITVAEGTRNMWNAYTNPPIKLHVSRLELCPCIHKRFGNWDFYKAFTKIVTVTIVYQRSQHSLLLRFGVCLFKCSSSLEPDSDWLSAFLLHRLENTVPQRRYRYSCGLGYSFRVRATIKTL